MKLKKIVGLMLSAVMTVGCLCGCGAGDGGDKVIIYSNADDEAVEAMKNALDNNGYKDKYIFTTLGTSELGGKLLAEGKDIEADIVTMSTYYIDSAQDINQMFKDLEFSKNTIKETASYHTPITAQEGAIIVNTQLIAEENLPVPTSVKDLAEPVYKDKISVTDVKSSSTAWLLIQDILSEYNEAEAKEILTGIYENAGVHIEDSGSGPIKKVRAGEVAIGFGLRHQAVSDKAEGLPIDFIDPAEGNFSLTESLAVVNKENANPEAMKMAECIIKNGRSQLLETYPIPLYNGETQDSTNSSGNPKTFSEPLTVDLLKKHQDFSESCK